MTVAARLSRGIERQIAGTFSHGVAVGTVDGVIAGIVTGGAVTAGGEILTRSAADQAAIGVMTAAAGVVNLRIAGIDQWRRITVTVAAAGAGGTGTDNGHQRGVVRGIGGVGHRPGVGMTSQAVTTTNRQTRL